MATIVLQTAGLMAGGLLGPVGAAIGSAAGALVGYAIDRALIDSTRHEVEPRLSGPRPFTAEEGAPIPRLYGTARLSGLLIWATRFEEEARTERQGGKGGPRVTSFSYFANAAFALCEGPIAGVRRVWADGRELDLGQVQMRVHTGHEHQPADPLIAARQGWDGAPAYRGTAYVVFERFPIGDYGNRVPQFHFEVMRPVGTLNKRLHAVALLPGSTEYSLSPTLVTRTPTPGEAWPENRHVLHAGTDIEASLDELQALCPNMQRIALVVTWFGDDLRAGACTVAPKVTTPNGGGLSQDWTVSGIGRGAAGLVSFNMFRAAYGGTPSDRSVMDAIAAIRARGMTVTLYPFVMMDIPVLNVLPDPHTGATGQPPYPWRGRITCWPGPALPGTADRTSAARAQVQAFCGSAQAGHFSAGDGTVVYGGPAEWSYRRMVLHYARLAVMAGGVDAFLLGSELRGLTALRDGAGAFPFVEQLCDLADQVRSIVGGGCKLTYGADWTEYFGHQPADGSGDVFFHLDPLWAHPQIDAVGIDNYMPLSDWRDGDVLAGNPDGMHGPHDIAAMRAAIARGEGYDWFYASGADRDARVRTPITDGAHGKPWVFRYKDLVSWWSNHHFNRPGGVEAGAPTAWAPASKPIWLTELGGPAVDKGPNQPNVFPDPKSSESALPYHSSGGRDDAAQLALARAHLDRWDGQAPDFSGADNPVSGVYGGRMVDASRLYFWAWDARPFPAFPSRLDVWGDGTNWLAGHWLNGRLEGATVADALAAILADHGQPAAAVDRVSGTLTGYVLGGPTTARAALEPLADLYGLAVGEEGGGLVVAREETALASPVPIDEIVVPDGNGAAIVRTRHAELDLPAEALLSFHDPLRDYQQATARCEAGGSAGGIHKIHFPGVLDAGLGQALLDGWCRRRAAAREQIRFATDHARIDVAPGRTVRLSEPLASGIYLVNEVETGERRTVGARRMATAPGTGWSGTLAELKPIRSVRSGPPLALFLDLPMIGGATRPETQLRLALRARPWLAHAAHASPDTSGFTQRAVLRHEATVGHLAAPLGVGFEGRFDKAGAMTVDLWSGALSSTPDLQLFSGVNRAAVMAENGDWEVLQFGEADEIEPGRWLLSRLLRGQCGTCTAMRAGAAEGAYFVLLDAAVLPAGLAAEEIGLALNWRVGPAGYDFDGPAFAAASLAGGVRARRPLPPAHLAATRMPDGDHAIRWTRRGRIDADRGLGGDVPLGEEAELYHLTVRAGGSILRELTLSAPRWTYAAPLLAADFPAPGTATVTVRQISVAAGAGDPATINFTAS